MLFLNLLTLFKAFYLWQRMKVLLLLAFLSLNSLLCAQEVTYVPDPASGSAAGVLVPYVLSVKFTPGGNGLGSPFMRLNSGERLLLEFDDISGQFHDYNYTLIHCNADGQPSRLRFFEYANGLERAYISDYRFSQTIYQSYVHYTVTLPNEQMKITRSGQYILKVFKNENPEDVVLTRRFYVSDDKVRIEADLHRAMSPAKSRTHHEIDVEVYPGKYRIADPSRELSLYLMQDDRTDNLIENLKPLFMANDHYSYNYESENLFEAGNEWRWFDIRSFENRNESVDGVVRRPDTMHLFLKPFKTRRTHSQLDRQWNRFGMFETSAWGQTQPETDADYAQVYFYFESETPFEEGDLYVFGEMSGPGYAASCKMKYNTHRKRYELQKYLKQGLYNFKFMLKTKSDITGSEEYTDGNHSGTLHRYTVLVYQRKPGDDVDDLIGIRQILTEGL
jgi:hypothetical protein